MSYFKDLIWVEHFVSNSYKVCYYEDCDTESVDSQMESEIQQRDLSLSSVTFYWRNYFEEEKDSLEDKLPDFCDKLTDTFTWKNYFNTSQPDCDEFPLTQEESWIEAENSVQPVNWVTLEDLNGESCLFDEKLSSQNLISHADTKFDTNANSIKLSPTQIENEDISDFTTEFMNTRKLSHINSSQKPSYYTEKRSEWHSPKLIAFTAFLSLHQDLTSRLEKSEKNDPEAFQNNSKNSNALALPSESCDELSELTSDLKLASVPEIEEPPENEHNIFISPSTPEPPEAIINLKPITKLRRGSMIRPYSSQGLFFINEAFDYDNPGESSLLSVPSTYHSHRRTSEPDLPRLSPPKLRKTFPDESKFWAVRKEAPWDIIQESETQRRTKEKSPFKKLKKIPHNRSRSAVEKPTDFYNNDSLKILKGQNVQKNMTLSDFRFQSTSNQINPSNENSDEKGKGIHSKLTKNMPKKHKITRNKKVTYKNKLIPAIQGIFKKKGFSMENSAKVTPEIEVDFVTRTRVNKTSSQSNLISTMEGMEDADEREMEFTNKRFTNRPKGADSRRRSPWVRFLKYWDKRWSFTTGNKRAKNRISKSHK